jgi:hypothetical protein
MWNPWKTARKGFVLYVTMKGPFLIMVAPCNYCKFKHTKMILKSAYRLRIEAKDFFIMHRNRPEGQI